jgi:adenine-specific DNA-methyltransferase
MSRLLHYGCHPDQPNLVLDFFSGSASFAHACLREPGLDLRFIAIQLPAPIDDRTSQGRNARKLGLKTISALGRERLRRAIKSLVSEDPQQGHSLGFRAFTLAQLAPDSTEMGIAAHIDDQKTTVAKATLEVGPDDQLHHQLLKENIPLTESFDQRKVSGQTVWYVTSRRLFLCVAPHMGPHEITEFIRSIIQWGSSLDSQEKEIVILGLPSMEMESTRTALRKGLRQGGFQQVRFPVGI